MGYATYSIPRPDQIHTEGSMLRGYNITDICHHNDCRKTIDRGLSYLCYGCTWYFCSKHLTVSIEEHECFAGVSSQACFGCKVDGPDDEEETRQETESNAHCDKRSSEENKSIAETEGNRPQNLVSTNDHMRETKMIKNVIIALLIALLSMPPAEAFSIRPLIRKIVHPPIKLMHTTLFHLEMVSLGLEHYFRKDIGSIPALLSEEHWSKNE